MFIRFYRLRSTDFTFFVVVFDTGVILRGEPSEDCLSGADLLLGSGVLLLRFLAFTAAKTGLFANPATTEKKILSN